MINCFFLSCQKCSCCNQKVLLNQAGSKFAYLKHVFWAALSIYFSLLQYLSLLEQTPNDQGEKKRTRLLQLEAALPDITPKVLLLSHFQSAKWLDCQSVYFFITMFSAMKSAASTEKAKDCAGIHLTFPFKTHAGSRITWAEMPGWGWLPRVCLGGCPAAHPAVSHPSLAVTAKPIHCRSSILS